MLIGNTPRIKIFDFVLMVLLIIVIARVDNDEALDEMMMIRN